MSTNQAPVRLYHLEGELDTGVGLSWPSIRRRWPVIAAFVVVGAIVFALISSPTYTASIPLQIPAAQPDLQAVGISFETLTATATPQAVKAYLESDKVDDDLESRYGKVELSVEIASNSTGSFAVASVSGSSKKVTTEAAQYVSELYRDFVVGELGTASDRFIDTLDQRRATAENRIATLESDLEATPPDGALAQALALDLSQTNGLLDDIDNQAEVLDAFRSSDLVLPVNLKIERGSSRVVSGIAGAILGAIIGVMVAIALSMTRREVVRRSDIDAVVRVLGVALASRPTQVTELMNHLSSKYPDGSIALVPVDDPSRDEAAKLAATLTEQGREVTVVNTSGADHEFADLRAASTVVLVGSVARTRSATVRQVDVAVRDVGADPAGLILVAKNARAYSDAA